ASVVDLRQWTEGRRLRLELAPAAGAAGFVREESRLLAQPVIGAVEPDVGRLVPARRRPGLDRAQVFLVHQLPEFRVARPPRSAQVPFPVALPEQPGYLAVEELPQIRPDMPVGQVPPLPRAH